MPVSHIKSFELLSLPTGSDRAEGSGPGFEGALPSIARLDLGALKMREEAAIRKLQEKDAMRGKGVTREAQEVFDWLARTYVPGRHLLLVNRAFVGYQLIRAFADYQRAGRRRPSS